MLAYTVLMPARRTQGDGICIISAFCNSHSRGRRSTASERREAAQRMVGYDISKSI